MENDNNNSNTPQTFWDFLQLIDPNGSQRAGVGVDHTAPQFGAGVSFGHESFPWTGSSGRGGWGWGGPADGPGARLSRHGRHGGRHGRRHRRDDSDSGEEIAEEHSGKDTPETMREAPEDGSQDSNHPPPPTFGAAHYGPEDGSYLPPPPPPFRPPPFGPEDGSNPPPPPPPPFGPPPIGPHHGPRHGPHHHGPHTFGGPGSNRHRGCGRGRGRPSGVPRERRGPGTIWDFRPMLQAIAAHPLAQNLRDYVGQTRSGEQNDVQPGTFTPPIDVFNTEKAYVLHVSLPGAVKEDLGVNFDPEKSVLNIAGVVYRPGNEEFLQSLTSSERKVGMFERSIKLPPTGSDEKDIDGFSINAKMENGILIMTVPKVEKESWTEVHKIDVE